ncbi:uncharacterized protein LOC120341774 isoform X1 [Styela clava]
MRQDIIALGGGLLFIVFILGMMWLWGELVDWDAKSGYTHYEVNSSQDRLMSEPDGCNDTSIPGRSGNHCTSTWYYWKLPPDETSALTRAFVWTLYALHQIFIWGLIYRAQLTVTKKKYEEKRGKTYSTDLRWFNWSMLFVNALFHVLHLVQTHTTYDATAQDVSISTSQASVIMMLVFILLMEYKDRGFMFMWPNSQSDDCISKKLRFHLGPIKLIRKYHGFAFAWASIYTFWYHPMENTWGHTLGFFHTAIVLLQGSLVYTEIHLNRYWRLLNECWVFIHATIVAVQTGNPAKGNGDIWPIFTFGFGFIFAFTQVFSFPFWKKISAWVRIVPVIIYFGVVCVLCGTVVVPKEPDQSGFSRMYEMVFIPAEEYMQLLLSWLFLFLFILIESKFSSKPTASDNTTEDMKVEQIVPEKGFVYPSPTKQALYLSGIILIYASFILGSHFYEAAHYGIILTTSMIFWVIVFSLGVAITIMFFKKLMGPMEPLYVSIDNKISSREGSISEQSAAENQAYVGQEL